MAGSGTDEWRTAFPQYADNVAFEEALDEVHTRFVLNLPDTELQTSDRIFFQLEQAWWFYEDFICDSAADDSNLPRFNTVRPFAEQLFCYSPLLPSRSKFAQMWNQFSAYKRTISNYGCILLNADCTKIVLCRLWKSSTHTLPAGKINQGENGLEAAARETYEETGFDPLLQFGLTNEWKMESESSTKSTTRITWKPPLEQDGLVYQEDSGKRRTCYVCYPVPEDFPFEPVARKEVSQVSWHMIDDLPRPSFGVIPFLGQLKKWINRRSGKNKKGGGGGKANKDKDKDNKTPNRSKNNKKNTPNRSRNNSRGRSVTVVAGGEGDDLVASGLAEAGESSGWSEEAMFQTNERILGRKVEYDGNPHVFAEKGFGGNDPHAFHVVGGTFLNSASAGGGGGGTGGIQTLAPQPEASKLQPLFRKQDSTGGGSSNNDDDGGLALTPFFSEEGATPWGEVVGDAKEAAAAAAAASAGAASKPAATGTGTGKKKKKKNKKKEGDDVPINPGQVLLQQLHKQQPSAAHSAPIMSCGDVGDDYDAADIFLTDAEITAKSQAIKTASVVGASGMTGAAGGDDGGLATATATATANAAAVVDVEAAASDQRERRRAQYEEDTESIRLWVANLPKPGPSKHFGEFKLDADAIMAEAMSTVKQSAK